MAEGGKKNVPCIFFKKGACRNGDACPFSHDPNTPDAPPTSSPKAARPPRQAPAPVVIELDPTAKYYSIDVECVATEKQHNARATAQIALIGHDERSRLNLYIKQEQEVLSYMEPLTGLSKELLDKHGIPLEQAMKVRICRRAL